MFAFILNIIIISVVMWLFLKFMYPKPPKAFFPKEGDDTSVRHCHYCGHALATYRGILLNEKQPNERFFVMLTISNLMPILIQKKIYQ
ncbi:hypothetical protein [Moraxella sp. HMSC061H09]|uniref:hypothetical protein n=1 Tax=Moraxella sp. HMSC061H09 TaxID=1715217 RepID=UPI000A525706|nr:hypothetical protein [Moraxella sp. HMSC061H09]